MCLANNIKYDGVRALADALKQNTTLTHLYLWSNDENTALALVKFFKQDPTLTQLDLGGNMLHERRSSDNFSI